jgi:acyl-CoA dehydrogenase
LHKLGNDALTLISNSFVSLFSSHTQIIFDIFLESRDDGHDPVPEICQLKIFASLNLEKNASDAISILGGLGLVTGTKSERIFRECKALQIGGGRTESMRDMAAHQLSY